MGKWGAIMVMVIGAGLLWSSLSKAVDREPSVYVSPEGIRFVSYSTEWKEDRLSRLYNLLTSCEHGEELNKLKQVLLYPERSIGKSGFRVGHYDAETATIRLYEVDATPVERTFIHEYGHHFTYYWLHRTEGIYPDDIKPASAWAELRQLDGFPVRWAGSPLPFIHKWDPGEIMAEDYVLLFGVGSRPMPEEPQQTVYFLRHENDYIPAVQTLPEIRRYWEKAAGLTPKQPLRQPVIRQWSVDGDKESADALHLSFTSSATDSNQSIQYGIRIIGFSDQGGLPTTSTTGMTAVGQEEIEASLDIRSIQRELNSFYAQIQIWALDQESKQLTYTPYYMNWFSYDADTDALKPIPLPLEKQGVPRMLKHEGMDRWPIVVMFMNGMPVTAVRKYDDNGTVYVPLRLFTEGTPGSETMDDANLVRFQFSNHLVQVQLNQEQAFVDGQSVRLRHAIKKIGKEPVVPVSELPTLLGAAVQLDEEGGGMFVNTGAP
ncbi:stalk domain-containing protein [Paenibacillus sp. NPDC056579]|uniref:stalk domain-containing protein n=1 Tax=Paenibacillus sp. NPDC056579 TaxID=3345871 RepID=UPI0036AF39F7